MPKLNLVESLGRSRGRFTVGSDRGQFGPTRRPSMPHRSLVIEAGDAVVIVDPGLGVFDLLAPRRRLGETLRRMSFAVGESPRLIRPILESRGISPDRVSDIVMTHAHPDVIGAVSDFPSARIHLLPDEAEARLFAAPKRHAIAHGPPYRAPLERVSDWHGFARHRLRIEAFEAYLVELPGHTKGHAGVLLPTHSGEVLYLGGAVDDPEELLSRATSASWAAWRRSRADDEPFTAMATRSRLRVIARRSKSPLTFVFARGNSPRLSVGPAPYPALGFL